MTKPKVTKQRNTPPHQPRRQGGRARISQVPNVPRGPRSTGYRRNANSRPDQLTVSKTELWYVVQSPQGQTNDPYVLTHTMHPGGSGVPHLDRVATIFEQYRINNMELHYRPIVGTTAGGNHLLAADYNANAARQSTLADLSLIQPNISTAAWQSGKFRLDKSRMMKGKLWLQTGVGESSSNTIANAITRANKKVDSALGGSTGPYEDNAFRVFSCVSGTSSTSTSSTLTGSTTVTQGPAIGQVWISYSITFQTAIVGTGVATLDAPGSATTLPKVALNRARMLGPTIPDTSLAIDTGNTSKNELGDFDWLSVIEPLALLAIALDDPLPDTLDQVITSKFGIDTTAPVSSVFSILSSYPDHTYDSSDINVTFTYPDGSLVPKSVIDEDSDLTPITVTGYDLPFAGKTFKIADSLTRLVTASVNQTNKISLFSGKYKGSIKPTDIVSAAFPNRDVAIEIDFPSAKNLYDYVPMLISAELVVAGGVATIDPTKVSSTHATTIFSPEFTNAPPKFTFTPNLANNGDARFHNGDLLMVTGTAVSSDYLLHKIAEQSIIDCLSANLVPSDLVDLGGSSGTIGLFFHNQDNENNFTFTFIGELGAGLPNGSYHAVFAFTKHTSRNIIPPPGPINVVAIFDQIYKDAIDAYLSDDFELLRSLEKQFAVIDTPTLVTKLNLVYGVAEATEKLANLDTAFATI